MSQNKKLRPQIEIKAKKKAAIPGRLGLVVIDDECHGPISFTAAQIVDDIDLFHEDVKIAKPSVFVVRDEHGQDVRHTDSMVVLLRLSKDIDISDTQIVDLEGSPLELGPVVEQPQKFIGHMVLIHNSLDRPRAGILYSPDSYFEMPAPDTSKMTLFKDALEIHSQDGERIADSGDAGALITLIDGRVLGILVGGIFDRCFAAPLWRLLRYLGEYEALNSEGIKNYKELKKLSYETEQENQKPIDQAFVSKFSDSVENDVDAITEEEAKQAKEELF